MKTFKQILKEFSGKEGGDIPPAGRRPTRYELAANHMERGAEEYLANKREQYKGDQGMIDMFEGDHKHSLKVINHVRNGNFLEAAKEWSQMDTGARGVLARHVWDNPFLSKEEKPWFSND